MLADSCTSVLCPPPPPRGAELPEDASSHSGKLALLDELLDPILASGEKVLVFTQFVRMARVIAEHAARRPGSCVW